MGEILCSTSTCCLKAKQMRQGKTLLRCLWKCNYNLTAKFGWKKHLPTQGGGRAKEVCSCVLSYRMGFVAFHMVPCNIKAGALILWLYAALCFVSCQSTVEVTDSLLPPCVFGSKRCDSSQMCHSAWYTLILILEAWGKTVVVIEIVILSLIGFETANFRKKIFLWWWVFSLWRWGWVRWQNRRLNELQAINGMN